jgi:hypothetical protein
MLPLPILTPPSSHLAILQDEGKIVLVRFDFESILLSSSQSANPFFELDDSNSHVLPWDDRLDGVDFDLVVSQAVERGCEECGLVWLVSKESGSGGPVLLALPSEFSVDASIP